MPGWMDEELQSRRQAGLHRTRRAMSSGQGVEVRFRLRDHLNFSSNDYLNYASDERLAKAAARAALRWGTGAGASPLITGHHPPLRTLERDLAAWLGSEAALVFSSGFCTNLAVVATLAGDGDVVFSDALNHASVIDGCRLSRSTIHVYRHNDLAHLESLLTQIPARRRFIVSDSVFSMEGDVADVVRLHELACRSDALLILDEAHATGILGPTGRGVAETLPPDDRVVKVGTLSKALGAQGGFVCGSAALIEYLVNFARPYIFSTALAPSLAAAARRAVTLVQQEGERRVALLTLAEKLRGQLRELGYQIGNSSTHIIPILLDDPAAALALSDRLEQVRLLVPAIRPPSVPPDGSRLRISLTAGHTEQDTTRLIEALRPPPATTK